MARRDDREYREYLREEQRSQRGCIARRMQPGFHPGLLSSRRARAARHLLLRGREHVRAGLEAPPLRRLQVDVVVAPLRLDLARLAVEADRNEIDLPGGAA